MSWAELTERLAQLITEQADIIKVQADALAQLGTVEGLEGRIKKADAERKLIIGE